MKDCILIQDLAINFPAVTYSKKQYDDAIIVYFADEPVVPYPVSPEISQRRTLHCFSDATGIVQDRYAFVKKFEDAPGVLRVKLGQFAVSGRRNFNLPSHDAS
jgi:hypothetical protein